MQKVCVCEYHQNINLVALPLKVNCKDALIKVGCGIESPNCMLKICENYPVIQSIPSFLKELFTDSDVDWSWLWYHLHHGAIIRTGITSKKITCYSLEVACCWKY